MATDPRTHPDRAAIVAAMTAHADLRLTHDERERLEEYVDTVWTMATRLREVDAPGLEGRRADRPLRTSWAHRPGPGTEPVALPRPEDQPPRPVPDAVLDAGLVAVADAIQRGEFTPADVTQTVLDRIARFDGALHAYVTVDLGGAQDAARSLGYELFDEPPRSLLHGIPIGVKDNIPVHGMPCTYNSPLLRDWYPQRDAEAVRRLRAAGAVIVGKHNLNEFGWSLPSDDDLTPPPRNPWFPAERSVGSTSGGGAAVAAGLALAAIGTDGGGSTRLPAGQHMLFGVKPGHDDVPRQGVGEGSVSEVGVLARTAPDAAAVLAALHVDPAAPDAAKRFRDDPRAWAADVQDGVRHVTLGVPEGYIGDVGMEQDVARTLEDVRQACQDLTFSLVEIPRESLDILHDAVRANFVLIAAEHYFDHEGPGKDRGRYGPSAGFYNLPGACITAADYLHAQRVGAIARHAIDAALATADLLLTPTSPVTRTSTARNPKTHRKGGNAAFTAPFNVSGHPAISFPAGVSHEGIPIGMQLVGPRGSELHQLAVAHTITGRLSLPPWPDASRVVAFADVGAGAR